MDDRLRSLLVKYREVIAYLIVGVLATIVSWGAKALFDLVFFEGTTHPTNFQNFVLSFVNWIAGVAFAYPTNRRWEENILKEATEFVASRVATLVLDILVMQLLGNVLGIDLYIATIISTALVVIGNYVFSKMFVFRK